MLIKLHIENIAIIDKIDIELTEGLNVLTGETGAGKSIIIDSVGLVLGGRADKELIKSGCEKALVDAQFAVNSHTKKRLCEIGIEMEDEQLFISRELSISGRNSCKINGRPTSLSILKEAAQAVVDMHGQHEHQYLLDPENHLSFIDNCAQRQLKKIKEQVFNCYNEYSELCQKLKKSFGTEDERERRLDMLNYQLNEIEQANLSSGEEEQLINERVLLQNSEKIAVALSRVNECLAGDQELGALDFIKQASSNLKTIASIDSQYKILAEKLDEAYYQLEDIDFECGKASEQAIFDPFRQEEVETRLALIYKLKKKYGQSVDEILAFAQKSQNEIDEILENAELAKKGTALKDELKQKLFALCIELSNKRRVAAKLIEEAMIKELGELGINNALFKISFMRAESIQSSNFSANGIDKVEMMLSANPSEPVKPLHKVASGGEMSRVMLAFKSIAADSQSRSCLIFDEIDTGISGRIATSVGIKMKKLSKGRQVISVTHSPQIAAMADSHFLIEKASKDEKVYTCVRFLNEKEHISEVARIMSGNAFSQEALAHAKMLVEEYKQ